MQTSLNRIKTKAASYHSLICQIIVDLWAVCHLVRTLLSAK
jgi:hypothetical protein